MGNGKDWENVIRLLLLWSEKWLWIWVGYVEGLMVGGWGLGGL